MAALLVLGTLGATQAVDEAKGSSAALAYLRAGQQALEAHDLRAAKAQLQLALKADPRLIEAHVTLGIVEYQNGDIAQAIHRYRRALRLQPDSFSAHYNLALACLRAKDLRNGLQELERAAALNPRHGDAAYNLGLVLLELGRPVEAMARLRQARALESDRPDVAFNLIRAELEAQQTEDGRREAESAAKTFGNDPQSRAALGGLFLDHA